MSLSKDNFSSAKTRLCPPTDQVSDSNTGSNSDSNPGNVCVSRQILTELAGGPLPDWHMLAPNLRRLTVPRGSYLFRPDERQPHIFFIVSGVIKMVYETADGNEWIKGFACENRFFASMNALQPNGLTSFAALALTDVSVERIAYSAMQQLAERHPTWQRAICKGLEIYGARKEKRERELLTQTPEQRYLGFLTENATLESRISSKDLARYIGVTPVSLSRIRARLHQR